MTDWTQWLSCPQCPAVLGEPCLSLLGAGPEALPSEVCEAPHSGRKRRGTAAPRRAPATGNGTNVARRAARRTESTAAAWLAVQQRWRRG
jgi:hypothetical protein